MSRYTVFSVDTARRHYIDKINAEMRRERWTPFYTRCINARFSDDLEREIERRDLKFNLHKPLTRGEMGIWMTFLNGIQNAPVVTFEDDAIVDDNFHKDFAIAMEELPEDADFFSLFIPRDSDHMFKPEHDLGLSRVCKTYQKYGGVSMYVTMAGAMNIMRLVSEDGIIHQWDNQLYQYAREGKLNGYTSMPTVPDLVRVSSEEETTTHNTERFHP